MSSFTAIPGLVLHLQVVPPLLRPGEMFKYPQKEKRLSRVHVAPLANSSPDLLLLHPSLSPSRCRRDVDPRRNRSVSEHLQGARRCDPLSDSILCILPDALLVDLPSPLLFPSTHYRYDFARHQRVAGRDVPRLLSSNDSIFPLWIGGAAHVLVLRDA